MAWCRSAFRFLSLVFLTGAGYSVPSTSQRLARRMKYTAPAGQQAPMDADNQPVTHQAIRKTSTPSDFCQHNLLDTICKRRRGFGYVFPRDLFFFFKESCDIHGVIDLNGKNQ